MFVSSILKAVQEKSVFTHVTSIYANLLKQQKVFT